LVKQSLENPYDKFRGRHAPFMHVHSKLLDSGDVSLYNQSTSEVAQRALSESNKDSNGERKNGALTKALQIKEQRGCVCGVFSKLTWRESFLEHKSTYQKQKMTSTPQVGVEELKRQLGRELLRDLKPIMES
jgi:hypothetical protein